MERQTPTEKKSPLETEKEGDRDKDEAVRDTDRLGAPPPTPRQLMTRVE